MSAQKWHDLGPVEAFKKEGLQEITVDKSKFALSFKDGTFGAISAVCNHLGGPLCNGTLDGEYVVCPWHYWKFHRATGEGEPGDEDNRVPRHEVKIEEGRLFINRTASSKRNRVSPEPHPLARPVKREKGPLRILGISTTVMDTAHPRYSTSEVLLQAALDSVKQPATTKLIRLSDLKFRHCEGFYSKSARACSWPCSITQMDDSDQLDQVYEAIVHWADVLLLATPIRWGSASSLYYKMVERMNCIQNQITLHDKALIRNKVASFIITGGQDNIQAVAGQMLAFFSEIGFVFPSFPYVAHSLGWTAENMERNVAYVKNSEELRQGSRELLQRALVLAQTLVDADAVETRVPPGGRKAHRLEPEAMQAAQAAQKKNDD